MGKNPYLSDITQNWVKTLLPFIDKYSARMTETELARRSGVPQQSVSRHLNKLVSLNLISYEREGRNKRFYFEIENQPTRILLNILESHKAIRLFLNLRGVATVIGELLKHCSTIIVFGSYASGKFDMHSDLDMVILGEHNKGQIKKVKNSQVMEINEHYATYDEFRKLLSSRNPLSIEIISNHVLFGESSKIIDIFIEAWNERK